MSHFIEFVNRKFRKQFHIYDELYQWSIANIPDFWKSVWEFGKVRASCGYDVVVDDLNKMPGASWFVGGRLNFAEHLLRYRDNHIALIFKGESQEAIKMTYAELYDSVARLAKSIRDIGVTRRDCVIGFMPNMIETVTAMLATTSIGAIWSSCSPDFRIRGEFSTD